MNDRLHHNDIKLSLVYFLCVQFMKDFYGGLVARSKVIVIKANGEHPLQISKSPTVQYKFPYNTFRVYTTVFGTFGF